VLYLAVAVMPESSLLVNLSHPEITPEKSTCEAKTESLCFRAVWSFNFELSADKWYGAVWEI